MCSSPVRGTLQQLSKLERPSSLAHGSEGPAAGLGRQHQMSRVAGGWIPSRVAAVKAVDGARSADPEHSWQQDLEDPSEEYVVQQANSANTVAVPLDKQQTVDLEADEWGSIWQAVKVQHQPVWPKEMGIPAPSSCSPRAQGCLLHFCCGSWSWVGQVASSRASAL